MPCPICRPPQPHTMVNCPIYGSTSEALKDFIKKIWEIYHNERSINGTQVYVQCFSGAPVHWEETWGSTFGIRQRLYLSPFPEHLMMVWRMLLPLCKSTKGCRFAKRCSVTDAHKRRDTMVVYFDGTESRDRFLDAVRKFHEPTPAQGGSPEIPPRLRVEMFWELTPGLTGRISGLRGFSAAADPGPGQSYGEVVSDRAAAAFNANHNSFEDFMGEALRRFRAANVNLARPWA